MRRDLGTTYGMIKQAHGQKKVYCEVNNCKQTLRFLRVLRDNSIIYGYSVLPKTNRVFVYLRYFRNRPAIKHLKLYSKQGHRRSLNGRNALTLLSKINPGNVAVVSTPQSSEIKSAFLIKHDREYHYINKTFGELLCLVW